MAMRICCTRPPSLVVSVRRGGPRCLPTAVLMQPAGQDGRRQASGVSRLGSLRSDRGEFARPCERPPPPAPPQRWGGELWCARRGGGRRGGPGADKGRGLLRRDREGQVVTRVCGRDRWLLRAQVALPGRVPALPRPAHAP